MADTPGEVTFLGADPPDEPAAESSESTAESNAESADASSAPPELPAQPRRPPRTRRWLRQHAIVPLAVAGALAAGALVARGVAGDPAPPAPSPLNTRPVPGPTGRSLPPPIPLPSWTMHWTALEPATGTSGWAQPAGHSFRPLR